MAAMSTPGAAVAGAAVVLVELHVSAAFQMAGGDGNRRLAKAARLFELLVETLGYRLYFAHDNAPRQKGGVTDVHPALLAAGLTPGQCCYEIGLVHPGRLAELHAEASASASVPASASASVSASAPGPPAANTPPACRRGRWCTGAADSMIEADCNGDGVRDWVCTISNDEGDVLRGVKYGSDCTWKWPRAAAADCPSVFGDGASPMRQKRILGSGVGAPQKDEGEEEEDGGGGIGRELEHVATGPIFVQGCEESAAEFEVRASASPRQ